MATPDDINTIRSDGNLHLGDLQSTIQYNETFLAEFIYMERDPDDDTVNLLYYEDCEVSTPHDKVILQPVPPGIDDDQASAWLDGLIDAGLRPFKSYFNVDVAGNYVSILPCRQGPLPPPPPGLDGWIATTATVFGLNMDGSIDRGDNGVGAPILGSIPTRNEQVVGCALPIPVLRARYGTLENARGKSIRVRKKSATDNGIEVQIVDLGPSDSQIAKGIALDLTYAAQVALQGDGMTPVEYHL